MPQGLHRTACSEELEAESGRRAMSTGSGEGEGQESAGGAVGDRSERSEERRAESGEVGAKVMSTESQEGRKQGERAAGEGELTRDPAGELTRGCLVVVATLGAVALRLDNWRRAKDTRSHSGT